jgi:hypothetical protein
MIRIGGSGSFGECVSLGPDCGNDKRRRRRNQEKTLAVARRGWYNATSNGGKVKPPGTLLRRAAMCKTCGCKDKKKPKPKK